MNEKKKKIFVQNQGSTTKKSSILKVEMLLKLVREIQAEKMLIKVN
jgi:hypothetical protein